MKSVLGICLLALMLILSQRVRPASPPLEPRRMNRSPVHDNQTPRYQTYRNSDPYRDYQRAPSPGVYDRYRDVSVGVTWNKSTTWYHPRDYYDSNQGPSSKDHSRRDSNGSTSSRTFEPWKNSHGIPDRERRTSKDYRSSPERYPATEYPIRGHERIMYSTKAPASPYNQRRSFPKEYPSPERVGYIPSSFRPPANSFSAESSRKPRSPLRSPRRYRSRTPSSSRAYSRSPSSSRSSRSHSRSRSPPDRRYRLSAREFEPDASNSGPNARFRDFHDSFTNRQSSRIPTGPRRSTVAVRAPSPGPGPSKEKARSRSSSQSSIASSRETSVKPRPFDPDDDKNFSVTTDTKASDSPSSKDAPNASLLNQLPTGYSVGSASELLNVLRSSNIVGNLDTDVGAAVQQDPTINEPAVDAPRTETLAPSRHSSPEMEPDPSIQSQSSNPLLEAPTASVIPIDPVATLHEVDPDPPRDPVMTTPRDPVADPPSQDETDIPPRDIPDYKLDDIPNISDAPTVREAVRVVVMRRLLADRQTRNERVEPVLMSNLALSESKEPAQKQDIHTLMTEMTHPDGDSVRTRLESANKLQQSLAETFKRRQDDLKNKVQRLTDEYISLHDKWKLHCAMLDRQTKARSEARLADTAANSAAPPMTGRTTRRSAATLGDAVRSDLEMEQIIASIGSNEATDPNQLCIRNVAVIPDMISVVRGKLDYVYDDNNLRVEDPISYYAPQTDDWTEEEKQIFIDKFAIFPKQFGAISRFLPNKSTAQCVDFYYLHKNVDIDFKNIVSKNAPGRRGGRRRTAKRKANALLADIRKHDAEVSSSASTSGRGGKGRQRRAVPTTAAALSSAAFVPSIAPEPRKPSSRRATAHLEGTPTTATPTPEPEARPKRRRVPTSRASLAASQKEPSEEIQVQPEPETNPEPEPEIESEIEPRPTKKARRGGRRVKSAAMVSDDLNEEKSTPPPMINHEIADPAYIARQKVNSDWSEAEKDLFLELLNQHGFDSLKLAAGMGSKTITQCSDYYQANEVPLGFRKIAETALKRISEASGSNGKSRARSAQTATTSHATFIPGGPPFPDMSTFFSHPGFSRYTTGVSPYGAPTQTSVPVPPIYPGQAYPVPNFGYPAPPGSATSPAAGFPSNATPYAGRSYISYPFPYQAGYSSVAAANQANATGTKPIPGVPSPYPPPANPATAQPFYPGYT
ncbi:hypothetical protein FB446DRAFT_749599 [Lentinula raphanica]|nr:hypothetical protein FB446DRAFT_749599 [Lentinula raphanica]